jgi:hypothetical protein
MTERVLIMGLPGAGKTTLAEQLVKRLTEAGHSVLWLNADQVRKDHDDWDFSLEGRMRQATRMRDLAAESVADFVIADFVAPLHDMRIVFAADWTIWMDTLDEGRFEDTNQLFERPGNWNYDFHITEKNADHWSESIAIALVTNTRRPIFDPQKPTVQLLGRWQPWHAGHRALFERALAKTGQVMIMVRDCQGWNGSNPFDTQDVRRRIRRDLDPLYQGLYEIMVVPNIVNITHGRDVGYVIEQEVFDDEVHDISATKIRKEMGLK